MVKLRKYTLIRSNRRSLALQIRAGELIVRAPMGIKKDYIDQFVLRKEDWISRHLELQKARAAAHPEPDEAEKARLEALAREKLPGRVAHFSALTGLKPAGIKISGAKTRFGSCSSRGSICFSWRLMAYPEEAIDYVVLHELCHLRHMNHGREFYGLIQRYMPDWRQRRELLKK